MHELPRTNGESLSGRGAFVPMTMDGCGGVKRIRAEEKLNEAPLW